MPGFQKATYMWNMLSQILSHSVQYKIKCVAHAAIAIRLTHPTKDLQTRLEFVFQNAQ